MGTFRDFSVQKAITPAASAVLINNTNTTNEESRAVYIGVDGDYKFYINGGYVTFAGTLAGSILPIRATGATTTGDAATGTTAIIFLY
tara:strand:+ start:15147 stop:15410 length:264 start_codon:yes stop_codon:yes gene_type:complete